MTEIWGHIVNDFATLLSGSGSAWFTFGQVILIDIVLAGDNAIVIGALAAGLPADQRKKVILIGIIAALVLRIGFALVVTQLMAIRRSPHHARSRGTSSTRPTAAARHPRRSGR